MNCWKRKRTEIIQACRSSFLEDSRLFSKKLIDRYADFTDLTEVFFDMNGKDGRDFLMQTQIEHKEQKAK